MVPAVRHPTSHSVDQALEAHRDVIEAPLAPPDKLALSIRFVSLLLRRRTLEKGSVVPKSLIQEERGLVDHLEDDYLADCHQVENFRVARLADGYQGY
jgi:flagella basal body P-ring formation protein FlgA